MAHAAIATVFAYGEPNNTHPHLVVCAVENESQLDDLFNDLKGQGVRCCGYTEPDMDNSLTAIATAPLRGEQRRPLRKLRLL